MFRTCAETLLCEDETKQPTGTQINFYVSLGAEREGGARDNNAYVQLTTLRRNEIITVASSKVCHLHVCMKPFWTDVPRGGRIHLPTWSEGATFNASHEWLESKQYRKINFFGEGGIAFHRHIVCHCDEVLYCQTKNAAALCLLPVKWMASWQWLIILV